MSDEHIEIARKIAWRHACLQRADHGLEWAEPIAANSAWRLSHPFNSFSGRAEFIDGFWSPLRRALPDLERRTDIFVVGAHKGKTWAASCGYYLGSFEKDWLAIPATRRILCLHFGEILEIADGEIQGGYILLDIVGAARQAAIDLVPRGLGAEIPPPAPIPQDGVRLAAAPADASEKTRALVEAMIAGLLSYDQRTLESMHQEDFWDPQMLWYGPCGVGAARGLSGFQRHHQIPFLNFVPDRVGGDQVARIADGPYFASGGWPSIRATTSGAPWISTPLPGGLAITMRVMDFWRREGDRLKENWVFIDIPDVFRQCGIDVFEKLKRH